MLQGQQRARQLIGTSHTQTHSSIVPRKSEIDTEEERMGGEKEAERKKDEQGVTGS